MGFNEKDMLPRVNSPEYLEAQKEIVKRLNEAPSNEEVARHAAAHVGIVTDGRARIYDAKGSPEGQVNKPARLLGDEAGCAEKPYASPSRLTDEGRTILRGVVNTKRQSRNALVRQREVLVRQLITNEENLIKVEAELVNLENDLLV